MKLKFIRHILKADIGRTKEFLFFAVSFVVFFVFTYAKAQTTYTEPSSYDLQLANRAVSSCRVLQDVISKNSQIEDIPAIQAFVELQKTEDRNLLIDNESCRESILEFISSLCSSSSSKNNLYCESLGIKKSYDNGDTGIDDGINDYKNFGQSAIDNLGIDLSDNISFESGLGEEEKEEEQSKLKFLAAGTLFYLSPVKKLRTASNVAARIKPVLSGALLILATLGLSSCSDATGPESVKPPTVVETPCTRRESGYFQLSGTDNECIKLPSLTYSFIANDGTESDSSNGDPDISIKLKFNSEVVFINNSGWQELTEENILEILEIKKNDADNDLTTQDGPITQDNIAITQESSNTVITISPPSSPNGKIYHVGDYSILTKNYAPRTDAAKVQQSSNTDAYITAITKESSFSITGNNPCVRGQEGHFYFRDANNTARCENLIPSTTYTVSSNNDPQATLEISFGTDIVYIDETGWSEIDENKILDILSINPVDTGADYTINTDDLLVEDGPINIDQITVTKTNSNITIEIDPPNTGLNPHGVHQVGLYQAGDYIISATNYIKRSDMDIVTQHNIFGSYLEAVKNSNSKSFSIDAVANLACGVESSQGYVPTIPIDDENQEQSFCKAYVHDLPPELAMAAHHNYQPRRADPNKTYVIDIGFVMSERYSTPGWDGFVMNEVIPHVNGIFQRSGVNVEFRAAAIVPFQNYRYYLPCQIDTIDLKNRSAVSSVVFNMIPVIRQHYGADLIYTIQNYNKNVEACGIAAARLDGFTSERASRAAYGSVDPSCSSEIMPDMSSHSQHHVFIETLSHEIGHNLGLAHNKEEFSTFPVKGIPPKAYGYRGEANTVYGQTLAYGTIMSVRTAAVPFFSANKTVTKEELCVDEDRHDNQLDAGFCPSHYDKLVDDQLLRLGDDQVDAAEALQYTIEDASKYSCNPGSC